MEREIVVMFLAGCGLFAVARILRLLPGGAARDRAVPVDPLTGPTRADE